MTERRAVVVSGELDVHSSPSEPRSLVCALPRGAEVEILQHRDDWYEIDTPLGRGWVGTRSIRATARSVTDYLWQIEELQRAAIAPPPEQQIAVPAGVDPLAAALAASWNQYGGLLGALCNVVGVDPACVLAVLHIESGGRGWGPDGRMIIRFENHLFRQFLANDELFNAHFAFDSDVVWQGHFFRRDGDWQPCHQNQVGEWDILDFARSLSDDAALLSISMGMPQVMGFNHALIGYPTVREMFDRFSSDIRFQILGMFDFIRGHGDTSPMLEALRTRNYEAFATGYNGTGQAVFYGGLIRAAVAQFEQLRGGTGVSVSGGEGTYTVQPGDMLGAIAARFGVSIEALAAANGITDPDRIEVGQVLRIPGLQPEPPAQPAATDVFYTVQPGDMLGRIAAQFGVSMDAVVAANGIANPDMIEVGQVLRIPVQDPRSLRHPRDPGSRPRGRAFETYVVLPGDSLQSVARRLEVSVDTLIAANNVQLVPGEILVVPAGGRSRG